MSQQNSPVHSTTETDPACSICGSPNNLTLIYANVNIWHCARCNDFGRLVESALASARLARLFQQQLLNREVR